LGNVNKRAISECKSPMHFLSLSANNRICVNVIVLGTRTDMEAHMGHDHRPYQSPDRPREQHQGFEKIDGRCIVAKAAKGVRKEN